MDSWVHPALLYILGAFLIPFLPGRFKQVYLLALPAYAFYTVLQMTPGVYGSFEYLGFEIVLGRVDKLSLVFAHVFTLMSFLGFLYGLHLKDDSQHMAACFYIGGSLGVTFAGDYLTVFIFWEMMAFASTFLIWFRREKRSLAAGYRYLLIHPICGIIQLAGIMLRYQAVGDITFSLMDIEHPELYTWLIMIGFDEANEPKLRAMIERLSAE